MKILLLLSLIFLFAGTAFAAESRNVSYKSGDETVNAVMYTPQGKGPFPALVVIHEWWGLNDWVKEQASKLADQGYVTLAIDLYRGKVATTPTRRTRSCGVCPKTGPIAICWQPAATCASRKMSIPSASAQLDGAWAEAILWISR